MKNRTWFIWAAIIIPIVVFSALYRINNINSIINDSSNVSKIIAEEPNPSRFIWTSIIISIVIFILAAYGVLRLQKIVRNRVIGTSINERIMKNGVPSTATILDISDTGNRIDRIYILVNIALRISETKEFESFEKKLIVPLSPVKIPQFTPGSTVKVFVDPATLDVAINESIK